MADRPELRWCAVTLVQRVMLATWFMIRMQSMSALSLRVCAFNLNQDVIELHTCPTLLAGESWYSYMADAVASKSLTLL